MTELKEDEVIRPQFVGKRRRSPITDDLSDPWYPAIKRAFLLIITFSVLIYMILISFVIAGSLMYARYILATDVWNLKQNIAWSVILTAIVQAVAIVVYDYFAKKIIYLLTRLENHKT